MDRWRQDAWWHEAGNLDALTLQQAPRARQTVPLADAVKQHANLDTALLRRR